MKEHMHFTYIVASRSHNFYVGITSDIEGRVLQHKSGVFEGYSKKSIAIVWFGWNGITTCTSRSRVRSS